MRRTTVLSPISSRARAVVSDGPFPNENRDGDEVPEWTVSIVDNDGDDLRTYRVRSLAQCLSMGRTIAKDRRLEWVNEAVAA